jgi:hypothetical protein
MRLDNVNFATSNSNDAKSPKYVIEIAFDTANTDLHYFTSHDDALLPAGVTTNKTTGCISSLAVTSQSIDPIKSIFTIGTISFEVVDKDGDVTTLLDTKWDADATTSNKRVRVYVGYEDLTTFTDYALIQTQLLGNIVQSDAGYKWLCRDIQRQAKNDIFEPFKTTLRAAIDFDDTFIPTFTAVDYRILHDSQYGDAPNDTVGYIRINDEIIRYSSVVTTPGAQGYVVDVANPNGRGALDTRPAAHGIDESSIYSTGTVSVTNGSTGVVGIGTNFLDVDGGGNKIINPGDLFYVSKRDGGDGQLYEIASITDATNLVLLNVYGGTTGAVNYKILSEDIEERQPPVTEAIYIEGPAPKIALKLLTGSYLTETFPDHWHLGIDSSFVASSLFTGIGPDWWDTSDDEGVPLRFVLPKPQDGKKFIEKEIMLPIGAFMPVGSDGQIGMRRMTGVLSSASGVVELNSDNIVSYSNLTYDEENIQNLFAIQWNWDAIGQRFTRNNILQDTASIAKFKQGRSNVLNFKGVHGSRTTRELLFSQLDSLRNRYAGYPKLLNVEILPSLNAVEVGDIVRVNLPQVPDHTGETSALDSAFEVQKVSVNWIDGTVNLTLFGSSETMTPTLLVAQNDVQPDSWYASEGTDLGPSGLGVIDGSGNVLPNKTISGSTSMSASGSIFYYLGDVTNPSSNTGANALKIDDNVQLRFAGFFQNDGDIDGAGRGLSGQAASAGDIDGTTGLAGYIGTAKSDGGADIRGPLGDQYQNVLASKSNSTSGVNPYQAPPLNLKWVSGALTGISGDFRGTSGGGGGSLTDSDRFGAGTVNLATGGTGGGGGASVVIISQGIATGIASDIDVSGVQGSAGGTANTPVKSGNAPVAAGSGASGCPGCVYVITDGATSTVGTVRVTANRPQPVDAGTFRFSSAFFAFNTLFYSGAAMPWDKGFDSLDMGQSTLLQQYLPKDTEPQPDVEPATEDVTSVSVAQVLDTNAQTTKVVSLEISVNEPTAGNYDYANAYVRISGSANAWEFAGVIPDGGELLYQVAADGTTWEVQSRSVSIFGIENPAGVNATITVINLFDPTQSIGDSDAATIEDQLPIPDITGLEIFGQGNDQEFGGRDCKFSWNQVAGIESVPFASEPDGLGAGAGQLDYYLANYIVRIFDDSGTELRAEATTDNWYIYSFEKNAEDFLRETGTVGAYRSFTAKVSIRSLDNREGNLASISVSNPAPELLTGVTLSGVFQGLSFKANPSDDRDFSGIRVWVDTSSSFTPGPSNLVHDGSSLDFVIGRLKSNTLYYLRYSPYDAYGPDDTNLSSELTVTTQSSLAGASAGGFVDTVAIGGAFVATGSNAWADIDPGDTVTIPDGTWRLDMGPVEDGLTTYVLRFHDGQGNKTFSIDSDGNGEYGGSLIANEFKTSTTGQRIEINPSSDNEMHFYGDRGDTTIEELATIGITPVGGDSTILNIGGPNSGRIGAAVESDDVLAMLVVSDSGIGVSAFSQSNNAMSLTSGSGNLNHTLSVSANTGSASAIRAQNSGASSAILGNGTSGVGVAGSSTGNAGVQATTTSTVRGAFRITPKSNTTDPSGGLMGDFVVLSDGTLKFHNGTSWVIK